MLGFLATSRPPPNTKPDPNCRDGEGLAWKSLAFGEEGSSSGPAPSLPPVPSLCTASPRCSHTAQAGEELKPGGEEERGRRGRAGRKDGEGTSQKIDVGFDLSL